MRRDEALKIISDNRERMREFPVRALYLFGSVARDEAKPRQISRNACEKPTPMCRGRR